MQNPRFNGFLSATYCVALGPSRPLRANSTARASQTKLWAERNACTKEKEFAAAHELFEIAQQVLESFKDRDPNRCPLNPQLTTLN